MRLLSILTVTKAEPYTAPFLKSMKDVAERANAEFVIAGDGSEAMKKLRAWGLGDEEILVSVSSKGYIESVLDQAINCCGGRYILRIDDDEFMSPEMQAWVVDEKYTEFDHWKFARAHLWGNQKQYITNSPLWPDHQTRLSIRKKSGNRTFIHAGSPYGGGKLAPVILEHFKFLVKSKQERLNIANRYDSFGVGLGSNGMLPFNLPEDAFQSLDLKPILEAVNQAEIDASKFN